MSWRWRTATHISSGYRLRRPHLSLRPHRCTHSRPPFLCSLCSSSFSLPRRTHSARATSLTSRTSTVSRSLNIAAQIVQAIIGFVHQRPQSGKAFRHGDIENLLAELAKTVGHVSSGGGGLLGIAQSVLSAAASGGEGAKFSGEDVKRVYFVSPAPRRQLRETGGG